MRKLLGQVKLPQIKRKVVVLTFCFVTFFVLGGTAGAFGYKYITSCKVIFSYINSNLGCNIDTSFDKSNPIVLKDKLSTYIDSEKVKGDISEVSVYFRDLNDGPTLGINEDDLFISASLLKLPIALTFYRLSEDGAPNILEQKLLYELGKNAGNPPTQYFIPLKSAVSGSTYTVGELIYYSLVYSDNTSIEILKTYLKNIGNGQDLILATFKDLGLTEPSSVTTGDISTRAYASIFRQLYNASYLSNEDSEKILSILSQSEFNLGIASGVPKNLVVANKFGERDLGKEKQLHDCGIVYYPGNPYLICVMTRGEDYNKLADIIKEISTIVYKEMDFRAKPK